MNSLFENELDARYWNQRWKTGQTGWDMGYASPPITAYLSGYKNKEAAILIPGCGNAYEAAWMVSNGFTDITLVDIAQEAVEKLKQRFKHRTEIKIFCEDFFSHQGTYDLIVEQTFFCAQVLDRRREYVAQMASLLKADGKVAGVLFGVQFENPGPPFGGNILEYETLFDTHFSIVRLEPCTNSIPERAGTELIFEFERN
ncbi:MAG TPA: methyltransferase domain-containing protein [Niabella sp.]|nr:methyltransferase domain-containing protein [Niabella sp.]HOZ97047.1 methyltransferase domain-containing protein [Niabella sp.]HQW15037.1 methyltransferase domain-containing protein [Niabella sp.]HQX20071.1 methyltransferase domain-containing protein [Niabella sp.]HQX40417.1 methyltransferase domain-containing protein [Niabella sp.]